MIRGVEITNGPHCNKGVNVVVSKGERGVQGERGLQGERGITPVKGVDYFTAAEIEEIKAACKYDDTALNDRVSTLESTIGTLNDSLEVVLNGGE